MAFSKKVNISHLFFIYNGEILLLVRDQCITHLCSSVKLTLTELNSSIIMRQMIILEMLHLSGQDICLTLALVEVLEEILEQKMMNTGAFKNILLRNLQLQRSFFCAAIESKRLDDLIDKYQVPRIDNHSHSNSEQTTGEYFGSTLAHGFALSLYGLQSELPIDLSICVFRKIVEIVNSNQQTDLPSRLSIFQIGKNRRSLFAQSSQHDSEISDELISQLTDLCKDTIFGECKSLFINRDIAISTIKWLFAQSLLCNHRQAIEIICMEISHLSSETLRSLADAFLYCNNLKHNFELSSLSDLMKTSLKKIIKKHNFKNLGEIPKFESIKILFLLNRCRVDDNSLYEQIYRQIPSGKDYTDYFQRLSDSIFSTIKDTELDWATIQTEINESLLINQHWDTDDMPPNLNCHNYIDHNNFLFLRTLYFGEQDANKQLFHDPISKLGLLSINRHRGKIEAVELVNGTFAIWREAKTNTKEFHEGNPDKVALEKCNLINRLRLLKCLEACSNRHPDLPQLLLIANLATASHLWNSNAIDKAERIIDRSINMIQSHSINSPSELIVRTYLKATNWAWSTHSKTAEEIKRIYLDAIPLYCDLPTELSCKVHYTIAKFFDEQFERLRNSEALKARRRLIIHAQKELDQLEHFLQRASPKDPASYERSRQQLIAQIRQDTVEIKRILEERESFAIKAASNYLETLCLGEKYDLTSARLLALWFSYRRVPAMNQLINSDALPLHKLLPLLYQIASRIEALDGESCIFQEALQTLLLRMLIAHPHHTLHQLLSLRAAASSGTTLGAKRRLVGPSCDSSAERRATAAASIINRAKTQGNSTLALLIGDTERLWQAYIELAAFELKEDKVLSRVSIPFDSKWLVKRLCDLSCPVPTITLPINPSALPITISGFQDGFRVIGGINLPKIIECIGSDGRKYRQLVKGHDDVRQVLKPCFGRLFIY